MRTTWPNWLKVLDDADLQFLRRFLLASGSLKGLAQEYDISYPTVRGRLDRLIAKVETAAEPDARDDFHRQVRALVADGTLNRRLAEQLLELHFATTERGAQ